MVTILYCFEKEQKRHWGLLAKHTCSSWILSMFPRPPLKDFSRFCWRPTHSFGAIYFLNKISIEPASYDSFGIFSHNYAKFIIFFGHFCTLFKLEDQTSLVVGKFQKAWIIVSISWLHKGQRPSYLNFLERSLYSVGSIFFTTLQIKFLTFLGTLNYQIFCQKPLTTFYVEACPLVACYNYKARWYVLLIEKMPFLVYP